MPDQNLVVLGEIKTSNPTILTVSTKHGNLFAVYRNYNPDPEFAFLRQGLRY